jgi:AP-3 complex subunit delta-1
MQQVNRSNIQSIVQQLLAYFVKGSSTLPGAAQSLLQNASSNAPAGFPPNQSPAFRLVLSQRILAMGSQSTYENVTNFEWYLSVLVDLAHIANVDIGAEIRDQLVDVVGRVRAVRPYGMKLMTTLLTNESMLHNAREPGSCSEVLWAAAWISGEYCEQVHIFLLSSHC